MDKRLSFGGAAARLIDDPKGYVFSMMNQVYIWLDNLLYLEDLAKRGQGGYTELYYEMFGDKAGPLLKARLAGRDHRRGQLLVHGVDRGGTSRSEVVCLGAASAYHPVRTGFVLHYLCR